MKHRRLAAKFGESGQCVRSDGPQLCKRAARKAAAANIGLLAGNVAGSNCPYRSGDGNQPHDRGVLHHTGLKASSDAQLLHQPGWTASNYGVKYSGVSGNSGGDCQTTASSSRGVSRNSRRTC